MTPFIVLKQNLFLPFIRCNYKNAAFDYRASLYSPQRGVTSFPHPTLPGYPHCEGSNYVFLQGSLYLHRYTAAQCKLPLAIA